MKILMLFLVLLSSQFVFARASLSTSPGQLSFQQYLGQTKTKYSSVFVHTFGDEPVTLSVNHTCSKDYRVSTTCYGAFWSNGTCSVRVVFAPQTEGNSSCFVRIWGNPSGFADVRITGQASKQPAIENSETF